MLAAIGLVVAIVLVVGGRWVAAAVIGVLALTFAGMFVSTAVRFPESRTAHAAVASRRWVRGRLVVAGVSLAAWSHAAGEIVRLYWIVEKTGHAHDIATRADPRAKAGPLSLHP